MPGKCKGFGGKEVTVAKKKTYFSKSQKMTPGDEDEATLLRGGRLAYGCYELTYTGRSGGTALEMDAATLNLRIALLQVTAVRSRLSFRAP